MSESTQQSISSALQLPPADRVVIANAILASLASDRNGEQAEIEDAWAIEIQNRVHDLNSGRVKSISSSQAWRMIDGEIELPN